MFVIQPQSLEHLKKFFYHCVCIHITLWNTELCLGSNASSNIYKLYDLGKIT